MFHILSEDDAFLMLQQRFSKLSKFDVIDLCLETNRCPCIVLEVFADRRAFAYVPLDRASTEMIVQGKVPDAQLCVLPSKPGEKKVMWNNFSC